MLMDDPEDHTASALEWMLTIESHVVVVFFICYNIIKLKLAYSW